MATKRCPRCGAALGLRADLCWLCGAGVGERAGQPASGASAAEVIDATLVSQETAATFSLTSLFLVMTLAAVAAGAFAAAPGLGILFLVVATPALARTMIITTRQKTSGVSSTPFQKIVSFIGSIGLVVLVLTSVVTALFSACLAALGAPLVLMSEATGWKKVKFAVAILALGALALSSVFSILLIRRRRYWGGALSLLSAGAGLLLIWWWAEL